MTLVIAGAAGQLGRHVIDFLLKTVPSDNIVAAVRQPARAADLAARGVEVRLADYDRPETLKSAFAGARKLLFISGSEVGRREGQHRAVVDAATAVKPDLVAYTSILRGAASPMALAAEHAKTEAMLSESGLPVVLLRNGWYTENYLGAIEPALAHGVVIGSSGEGRIASAARADYAEAAAVVLTRGDQAGRVYELAGDERWTMADFAAELSRQSGKTIAYQNLPESDYAKALVGAGLPEPYARAIADSSARAASGALDDAGGELGKLIGRPTTRLRDVLAAALAARKG